MSRKPRRVKIGWQWYDVHDGWAGKLELRAFDSPSYTAEAPYVHMDNLFFVKDSSGCKVGEIDTHNRSCSGAVESFEM